MGKKKMKTKMGQVMGEKMIEDGEKKSKQKKLKKKSRLSYDVIGFAVNFASIYEHSSCLLTVAFVDKTLNIFF